MLCRNCGAENPNNNKFCVQCGTKFETQPVGVDQQRVISDKHYSLDDISKQQNESELKSSKINLSKEPSEQLSENQYIGAVTGEPYKMKSAGFEDEKEPVKRPPITGFENTPEQNSNQPQNNNYSFGGTPQNNNPFGSNNNQPQNNNYSFGGTPQNNNTFGSNNNQPQNNNYSFGGTSQNNNPFGSNNTQPQNNNYSFGSAPNQNNTYNPNGFSVNNQNNQYSPTAVQNSQKNSNVAKIMIIAAIAIGVILIVAIVFMVTSGHYTGEPENSQSSAVSGVPSTSSVPGTSSVPSVSGGTGSSNELSGNTDFSNVVYSNLANMSLATRDDSGNVYYSDDNSYIQKQDPTGNKTKIYDAWSTCLNYYNDRLYFISSVDGYSTVCSIKTDGSDFKTHTNHKDVSILVVSDGYAYYAINHYGSSSESGAVFRVNLSSGTVDNLLVVENSNVLAIFDYGDNVYVHYMDIDSYIGSLKRISKNNLSDTEEINSSTNDYDYYSVTIANDKFYFVTYDTESRDYIICSMNTDGSDGTVIGGSDCEMISVYGDYIYYTMSSFNGREYPLYRMKLDGTDDTLIYEENVSYMSIVGDKMYYLDRDADEMRVMNLDGSGNQVLE